MTISKFKLFPILLLAVSLTGCGGRGAYNANLKIDDGQGYYVPAAVAPSQTQGEGYYGASSNAVVDADGAYTGKTIENPFVIAFTVFPAESNS